MSDGPRTEGGMGRKQPKNITLDQDVVDVVAALQSATGATMTRIVTAALLQYLFDPGPQPLWMQLTLSLERGELELPDVPLAVWCETLKRAEYAAHGLPDEFVPAHNNAERTAVSNLLLARGMVRYWETGYANARSRREALLAHFRAWTHGQPSVTQPDQAVSGSDAKA